KLHSSGPNGTPITILGTITVNRPQNTSWVYTGMPRNTKMYAQLTPRSTGLSLRRMIAAVSATIVPSTIDSTVSSSVQPTPWTTFTSSREVATVSHSSTGLVTRNHTRPSASVATTTAEIHVAGRGAERALIGV